MDSRVCSQRLMAKASLYLNNTIIDIIYSKIILRSTENLTTEKGKAHTPQKYDTAFKDS